MQNIFLGKDIVKVIERLTGKSFSLVTEEDLEKISRLSLNKKEVENGAKKDYCLKDMARFKNLKALSLSGFDLTAEDIEVLHSLPFLNFVHFDFCTFHFEKLPFSLKWEFLVFNVCKNIKASTFDYLNAKSLKFVGSSLEMEHFRVCDFQKMERLEELSLNRYFVHNIEEILGAAPNIKILNLDGSVLSKEEMELAKSFPFCVHYAKELQKANAYVKWEKI